MKRERAEERKVAPSLEKEAAKEKEAVKVKANCSVKVVLKPPFRVLLISSSVRISPALPGSSVRVATTI